MNARRLIAPIAWTNFPASKEYMCGWILLKIILSDSHIIACPSSPQHARNIVDYVGCKYFYYIYSSNNKIRLRPTKVSEVIVECAWCVAVIRMSTHQENEAWLLWIIIKIRRAYLAIALWLAKLFCYSIL